MTQMRAFLVTTAKNEAPYFLEWVAHHLEIGFTDIVIFQNDSDDLTHEMLSTLRSIGAIQYFYNRAGAGRHQVRAYERGGNVPAYAECDWAMALDMDEFLVVKTGDGTLTDLMKALPESDCIHLNWRLFGNSGYETLTDQLVTERFTMASYQLGRPDHYGAYKCMFRPSMFKRPGIHRPYGPDTDPETVRFTNGSGLAAGEYLLKNYNSTDPKGCKLAQINHYIVRDLASFMLKSARGSAHQANRPIGQRYWAMRNTNFEIDDSMQPYLARVKARMEALNEASGGRLMDLRGRAIFRHMARYYTMLEEAPMRDFRTFCKDNPNAVDHRKVKAERAKVKKPATKAAAVKKLVVEAPEVKTTKVKSTDVKPTEVKPAGSKAGVGKAAASKPKVSARVTKTPAPKTSAKAAT